MLSRIFKAEPLDAKIERVLPATEIRLWANITESGIYTIDVMQNKTEVLTNVSKVDFDNAFNLVKLHTKNGETMLLTFPTQRACEEFQFLWNQFIEEGSFSASLRAVQYFVDFQ
jgi:hypothetical protein